MEYTLKYVYRVWYAVENEDREAFFTNKADAEEFALTVAGIVNKWVWKMLIEK